MSAADLLLDLGRLGIRLEAEGSRLRYYPRSALTPDLLQRLKAHKAEVVAELTAHREAILAAKAPPDPLADPIFLKLTDWLWEVIRLCNGECITDEHGRRCDVLGIASELYMAPWSVEWLAEVEPLYNAVERRRRAGEGKQTGIGGHVF
jgi:hypothetical protein